MVYLLWLPGLWALALGEITISSKLRLKGKGARAFGGMVLAYALVHPLVIRKLAGVVGPGGASFCDLILIIAALCGFFNLTLKIFPEARDETPLPKKRS